MENFLEQVSKLFLIDENKILGENLFTKSKKKSSSTADFMLTVD